MKSLIKIQSILALILFFCTSTTIAASEVSAEQARELIQSTAEDVISDVKAHRTDYEANPTRLYSLVNNKVAPNVDFSRMSRWVLGKHWKKASKDQKVQFTGEFKKLLIRTYSTALLKLSDEEILYPEVEGGVKNGKVKVRSEIILPDGKHFTVQYRMHSKDVNWKIFDITVDGVSLVSTYRSSFSSEINKVGLAGLLSNLVDKNQGLDI
ncbi:MAG: phospholipid-binding protein MlaC [Gammaproteobacteria bacterium]